MSAFMLDPSYQERRAATIKQMSQLAELVKLAEMHLFGGTIDAAAYKQWGHNISMAADALEGYLEDMQRIKDEILDRE